MTLSNAIRHTLIVTGLTWAGIARAGLGGDTASVDADAATLHGAVSVRADTPVRMLEIEVDNGIQVREWLDAAGVIFAVSWNGPAQPDMRQLLGSYYAQYTTALSALPTLGRVRAVHVRTEDLLVESDGHLRAYSGYAYLPARVPAGVATTTLR